MPRIRSCDIPTATLLRAYRDNGSFADCYVTDIDRVVTHVQYVTAFYTTWLFKIERFILHWLARRPSSDEQARHLAQGVTDTFAAWHVEARAHNQILLADFTGRTRSWLMVESIGAPEAPRTRLYFGSAVVPKQGSDGERRLGFAFAMLLGFHKLYSQMLLRAAWARLCDLAVHQSAAP